MHSHLVRSFQKIFAMAALLAMVLLTASLTATGTCPEYILSLTKMFDKRNAGLEVHGARRVQAVTGHGITFGRTGRSLESTRKLLPDTVLEASSLQSKMVLDAGCGDGGFVMDLRKQGVNAHGIDLHLNAQQQGQKYFAQADMTDTGLPGNSFDVIYSIESLLTYPTDVRVKTSAITELARILKPGGQLVLAPVDAQEITAIVASVPGLSIIETQRTPNELPEERPHQYMILQKAN